MCDDDLYLVSYAGYTLFALVSLVERLGSQQALYSFLTPSAGCEVATMFQTEATELI